MTYVVRCAIWYYLYNLKKVKNTHGGVLFLVKLLKITLLHGCFSCFLICTNGTKSRNAPHIEILLTDTSLGPALSSTSLLNKIKRLYNHATDHIVIIATRKDSVCKCLVLLYELNFNVRNTEMSNTIKKLMLHNGKTQF